MRPASDELREALAYSFELTFSADLWYDNERRIEGLRVLDPSIVADSRRDIEMGGTLSLVWADDSGRSIEPATAGDLLAPFGSRLVVFAVVNVGGRDERIQLGDFSIVSVPSVDGHPYMWGAQQIHAGQVVNVVVQDRTIEVRRDRFTQLSQPSQLDSVYSELASLTGFPIRRTLPDAPITRSVVYEEDRLNVVQDLAEIIGGRAFMDWDGALTVRPLQAGPPVAELAMGDLGTITQLGSSLDSDAVYNGVVIRGQTNDQQVILAEAWIESGPLRATRPGQPRTPWHRVPRFYSSPFITTSQQAQDAAPALLEQFSSPRASSLEVTCITNPLLQVGDVVAVLDGSWEWTLRLTRVPIEASTLMTVTGDVLNRELVS